VVRDPHRVTGNRPLRQGRAPRSGGSSERDRRRGFGLVRPTPSALERNSADSAVGVSSLGGYSRGAVERSPGLWLLGGVDPGRQLPGAGGCGGGCGWAPPISWDLASSVSTAATMVAAYSAAATNAAEAVINDPCRDASAAVVYGCPRSARKAANHSGRRTSTLSVGPGASAIAVSITDNAGGQHDWGPIPRARNDTVTVCEVLSKTTLVHG
jgi:hypothetical protein